MTTVRLTGSRRSFRPENAAKRADYDVRRHTFAELAAFIREHHYAKGCANTATEALGVFRRVGGALVGAALWMPPTRVCAESVDRADWRRVLSLSRLAVAPGEPTNVASILIGGCVRTFIRDGRWTALVTYADESQGHTGTIYRATNWRYLGRTKPEPRWVDAEGKQVSRLATKSRTAAQMTTLGHRLQGKFSKHKFVMRLAPERCAFCAGTGKAYDPTTNEGPACPECTPRKAVGA